MIRMAGGGFKKSAHYEMQNGEWRNHLQGVNKTFLEYKM